MEGRDKAVEAGGDEVLLRRARLLVREHDWRPSRSRLLRRLWTSLAQMVHLQTAPCRCHRKIILEALIIARNYHTEIEESSLVSKARKKVSSIDEIGSRWALCS